MTDFDKAIEFVLKWEGGLTTDTGGLTKYGISQNAYPDLDIANLTLDQAKAIYKEDYWDKLHCDNFYTTEAIVLFDCGVNCGVARTIEWLGKAEQKGWREILLLRIAHYTNLAQKPKYQPYFRGWMNRTMDLYKLVNGNV